MSITNINNAVIDSKVFTGYTQESYELLDKVSELNKDFKELVETVAETTGLEKKIVSKYLKARYKEQTKDASELGIVFDKLDEILTN
jgi:predicted solute-binding protein